MSWSSVRAWIGAGIVGVMAWLGGSAVQACDEARFVMDGDGVVIDSQSMLMWRACPEGLSGSNCQKGSLLGFSWRQGVEQVARVNASTSDGYGDWAIPTLSQLQSLAAPSSCGKGGMDPSAVTLLPSWPSGYFWSRNHEKGRNYVKRTFSFDKGQAASTNEGTFGVHLWLVRKVE